MEPRIRVALCLTGGNRLMLVAHRKAEHRYWLLPGGGVERGETLVDAARRELREEAGVDVEVERLVVVCEVIEPGGRHVVNLVFAGREAASRAEAEPPARTGGVAATAPRDAAIDEVRWVTRAELLKLELHPPIARAVAAAWDAGFAGEVIFLGNVWVADPRRADRPAP